MFPLERDEHGYPPDDAESLWANKVTDSTYQLDNIPWFAVGVSWGDLVRVRRSGAGELLFEEVVKPSGHSTVRVIVYELDALDEVIGRVERIGCSTENSHVPGLFSVDIPPNRAVRDQLTSYLAREHENDVLDYEESCIATLPS